MSSGNAVLNVSSDRPLGLLEVYEQKCFDGLLSTNKAVTMLNVNQTVADDSYMK